MVVKRWYSTKDSVILKELIFTDKSVLKILSTKEYGNGTDVCLEVVEENELEED